MGQMENVEEILPLSSTQSGMLYETIRSNAPDGTYVGVVSAAIDGALDGDALKSAMEAVIRNRDAFRACFIWEGVAQPLQIIRKTFELPFTFMDLTGVSDAEFISKHHLIWAVHHIISDGWSTGVVLEEIAARLDGETPDRPAQFRDYLGWQQNRDKSQETAFWTDYLEGITGATSLAVLPPTPGTSRAHLRRTRADIPLEDLKAHARAGRVTLTTVLSTAWALVMRRMSGSDDVVFGQTHSGRPANLSGIDRAVGAFISTLPLRLKLDPCQSWADLLAHAEGEARQLRQYQCAGLADVRTVSPLKRDEPLFETLFVLEDAPAVQAQNRPVRFRDIHAMDASTFPLAVLVSPGEHLGLEAIFDPNTLSGEIVDGLLDDYVRLLAEIPTFKGTLTELAGNSWVKPQPDPVIPTFSAVHEAILTHARSTPEADALYAEGVGTLSYLALEQASADIAARLQANGVGKGDIVPIALERGPDVVIAMLGILRAGAAYTPLDLEYPPERLAHILTACSPRVIVTNLMASDRLPASKATLLFLDEPDGPTPDWAPVATAADDLAYVIFTSGSTGGPKGVMISHGNLAYSTSSRGGMYPDAPNAFLMLSSFAFDSSVVGIYWTLASGGTLVISRPRLEQDMEAMGDLIETTRVSHLLCLPALYQTMLTALPPTKTTSLKTVIVAGEAVPLDLAEAHRAALPNARLFNEYGPTEATVWCAATDITTHDATTPVPIGTPPPGTTLIIADPDGHQLPQNTIGEIIVNGPGIAKGYWQNKDATKQAFSEHGYKTGDLGYANGSGQVVFRGRRDAQIKIRGHRIELADVETALARATKGEATVLAREFGTGLQLWGFVTGELDLNTVRRTLAKSLPGYMIPTTLTQIDEMPRLPNGKIDTKALLALEASHETPFEAPQSLAEKTLARVWADVLGQDKISRSDDFFDLGGDSLKTITVGLKAEDAGLHIAPHEIFEYPRLSDLASQIHARAETAGPAAHDNSLAVTHETGTKPLFFMVHGSLKMHAYLNQALGTSRPLAFLFSHFVSGDISASDRLEDLARDGVTRLKALKPHGPYHLGGYSLGAVIAFEMARQLRDAGDRVETLFLLDPSYAVRMPAHADTAKPSEQTQRLLQYTIGQALMMYYKSVGTVSTDATKAHLAYVGNAYRKILTHYQPSPYDGPVDVLMTDDVHEKMGDENWLTASMPQMKLSRLCFAHLDLQKDPEALLTWTTRLAVLLNKGDG